MRCLNFKYYLFELKSAFSRDPANENSTAEKDLKGEVLFLIFHHLRLCYLAMEKIVSKENMNGKKSFHLWSFIKQYLITPIYMGDKTARLRKYKTMAKQGDVGSDKCLTKPAC